VVLDVSTLFLSHQSRKKYNWLGGEAGIVMIFLGLTI